MFYNIHILNSLFSVSTFEAESFRPLRFFLPVSLTCLQTEIYPSEVPFLGGCLWLPPKAIKWVWHEHLALAVHHHTGRLRAGIALLVNCLWVWLLVTFRITKNLYSAFIQFRTAKPLLEALPNDLNSYCTDLRIFFFPFCTTNKLSQSFINSHPKRFNRINIRREDKETS